MSGYHLDRSQTDNIWVIGNGESRKDVNLDTINGITIGCNAIHRDFVCDKIVAVDRRMVDEILKNPKYQNTPIYTRPQWVPQFNNYKNVTVVPELPYIGKLRSDDPWHWNSGPFAVLLGCLETAQTVNLLGFDLYSSQQKLNNLYKNTDNYGSSDCKPVDHSYWLHQLKQLFIAFPNKQFIQWQKMDWQMPECWMDSKNLTFNTINV